MCACLSLTDSRLPCPCPSVCRSAARLLPLQPALSVSRPVEPNQAAVVADANMQTQAGRAGMSFGSGDAVAPAAAAEPVPLFANLTGWFGSCAGDAEGARYARLWVLHGGAQQLALEDGLAETILFSHNAADPDTKRSARRWNHSSARSAAGCQAAALLTRDRCLPMKLTISLCCIGFRCHCCLFLSTSSFLFSAQAAKFIVYHPRWIEESVRAGVRLPDLQRFILQPEEVTPTQVARFFAHRPKQVRQTAATKLSGYS